MADPKQLRFQFVVDEASLQKTRQLIRELTADLAKLNEQAGRAGGGIGGGGGSAGVNVSAGGARSAEQQRVIAKTPPMGRQLVQGFLDQKNVFKGIADGSKDSLRVMNESLKQAIAYQKRELKDLDNAAQHLAETYDELGAKMKSWSGGKATSAALGRQQQGVGVEHMKILAERAKGAEELEKLQAMAGGGGGMFGGGKSALMSLIKRLGGGSMIAGAGLGIVGAWGARQIANQVWNGPLLEGRSDAAYGQAFGSRSLDIRNGEFRNSSMRASVLSNQSDRNDYMSLNSGWRRFASGANAFVHGNFHDAFSGRAADEAVMARQDEYIQNRRKSNPLMDELLGEFQNYQGSISSARAMGIGARKEGDKESGSLLQALSRMRSAYKGFSDGEISGAFQTLASNGARGSAHRLIGTVLQGEAAGIQGLGASTGIMSRFGGGAAFADTARRYVGGGMDATTAGITSAFVAQQQAALGMNTGAGAGDFQGSGLMSMLGTGAGGPGGRLIADQNIRGAEYLQRSVTGQTSPYQGARNLMMAMQTAPGLSPYGTSFLARKMSLSELADAASGRGGDVNDVFQALGGNKKQAGAFFRAHTQSLLEGVSGAGMGDTLSGKMARALASSGMDPREFFKSKAYRKAGLSEKDALKGYAGALSASENLDGATAMGLARDITGVGGGPRKGRAAGDPTGGSKEMQLAAEHIAALNVQVQAATAEFKHLVESQKNLRLTASLEQQGLNMASLTPAKRALAQRAIANLGEDANMAQLDDMMKRIAEMDRRGHLSKQDRINEDNRTDRNGNKADYGGH